MTDKNLNIRVGIDAKDFDRQIQDLQRRLNQMTRSTQTMQQSQTQFGGSKMGSLASQFFGGFNDKSVGELREKFNLNVSIMERQAKLLDSKHRQLGQIQKIESDISKEDEKRVARLKEEIQLLEKKGRLKVEENLIASNAAKGMGSNLEGFKGLEGAPGAGAPPGGAPPGGGRGGRIGGLFGAAAAGGAAMLMNQLVSATVAIVDDVITRERKLSLSAGSSLTGASRELRQFYEGQGSEAMFFAKERARAAEIITREAAGREVLDKAKANIKQTGGMAAGMIAGAGIGAFAGPIGAGVGMVVGGIGGALTATDERDRAALYDPRKHQQMLMQEAMQSREQIEASQMAKDPSRFIGRKHFMGNADRYTGLSRALGGADLFGAQGTEGTGFLRREMTKGRQFGGLLNSEEDVIGQAQQIIQAGGSTSAGLNMAGTAAGFNRQFNINNAGSMMGAFSGAGLSNSQSEDAVKRILSEAVRAGVNASTMPQEMQRFSALAANIASAGGGFSQDAISKMAAGLTGTSASQISAAAGAQQSYEDIATTSEGYRGMLGFGFMESAKAEEILGEGGAKNLRSDSSLMNALNQLSVEKLERDPALLEGYAEMLGVPSDTLMEFVRAKDKSKQLMMKTSEEAAQNFKEVRGDSSWEDIRKNKSKAKAYAVAYTARATEKGKEFTGLGLDQYRSELGVYEGEIDKEAGIPSAIGIDPKIDETLAAPKTSPQELEANARATGQLAKLEALNKNIDEMAIAAKNVTVNSVKFAEMFEAFASALQKNPEASANLEALSEALKTLALEMQGAGIPSGEPK